MKLANPVAAKAEVSFFERDREIMIKRRKLRQKSQTQILAQLMRKQTLN